MKTCAAALAAVLLGAQLSAPVTWAESIEEKKAELEDIQQQMTPRMPSGNRKNRKSAMPWNGWWRPRTSWQKPNGSWLR